MQSLYPDKRKCPTLSFVDSRFRGAGGKATFITVMMRINGEPFCIVDRAKSLVEQYMSKEYDLTFDVTLYIMATGSVLSYLETEDLFPESLPTNPCPITKEKVSDGNSLKISCKHLRNAIAHSHIKVIGDVSGNIEKIQFKDFPSGNKAQCKYDLEISVDEFKNFFSELTDYALEIVPKRTDSND